MRIAALQHDIVWEDPDANFERLAPRIAEAADQGAELVVLSELFSWGFSMATERVREPVDGASTRFLLEQAAATGAWTCGSVPVVDGQDRPFNRLLVASPGGELHRYDKRHPFSPAGEHEHYEAGDAPLQLVLGDLRVSFHVCYDLRFGDELWELAETTDLYVVVANWPSARREHWMTLLAARAIDNQAHVLGVNRVGTDPGLEYSGDTRWVAPLGEVECLPPGEEGTLLVEPTAEAVREARRRLPFLRDRRN
ncbi:MAG: nitrilase-related carbon-nitrogen hydrolase [Acidobacteriota bacterium]